LKAAPIPSILPRVYQKPENPRPGTKIESFWGRIELSIPRRRIEIVRIDLRGGVVVEEREKVFLDVFRWHMVGSMSNDFALKFAFA